MTEQESLARMIAPGQRRRGKWLQGTIQVQVTRVCNLACCNCTQGSNLGGKPAVMRIAEFEQAVLSLRGYWGVVGIFGGNPAMHPRFPDLCEVLRRHVPFEQRGLWCNHPKGHAKLMRETFDPRICNLNVHLDREAWDEFRRDWPEARPFGLYQDSRHSPPFVAMVDVETDEAKRWEMIARCDINRNWSALIGTIPGKGLRAYFCEVAYSQAALHADDPDWPDVGLAVEPGWWKRPMQDFAAQVRQHCHRCGVPLQRFGSLAVGGKTDEASVTHAAVVRPKRSGRRVSLVTVDSPPMRKLGRMTDYVNNGALV